jgi:hypothetical protein
MMRILKDFRNRANAPLGHSLVHCVVVQDESLLQLAQIDVGSRTNIEQTQESRESSAHKRNWTCSSSSAILSEYAVSRLGKRQKTFDLNAMVKHWVESACG